MNWSTYRTQIRRTILKDSTSAIWSDNALLADAAGWAFDQFCAHTAAVSSVTVSAPVVSPIALPDNIYGDLETTGYVYTLSTGGTLTPIAGSSLSAFEDIDNNYSVFGPELHLAQPLGATETLTIRYFGYYPHPVNDEDVITLPQWALGPVAHLIGGFCLTSESVASSEINQWKDKKDSGTPEDNALTIQQHQLFRIYESGISRFAQQRRDTFWKTR